MWNDLHFEFNVINSWKQFSNLIRSVIFSLFKCFFFNVVNSQTLKIILLDISPPYAVDT